MLVQLCPLVLCFSFQDDTGGLCFKITSGLQLYSDGMVVHVMTLYMPLYILCILFHWKTIKKKSEENNIYTMTFHKCSCQQMSLIYYFNCNYFCYVQVKGAPQRKSCVHRTGCEVWNIQGCLPFYLFLGFILNRFWYDVLLVLKRKLFLSVMCIMTPLSL